MGLRQEIGSLGGLLSHHARVRPDRVAMHFEGRETSYADFERDANRTGHALTAAGIGKGERVAYLARSSDLFARCFLGAAKVGAVMVPVNWRLAPPEIAFILKDAEVRVLFVSRDYAALIREIRDQLPDLALVIALDPSEPDWPVYDRWIAAQPNSVPPVEVAGADDLIQLYTSGTTGNPKGARLVHDGFLSVLDTQEGTSMGRWTPDDVCIVMAPLFHVGGIGQTILCLGCGGKAVILAEFDAGRVLETIAQQRITKVFAVPAMILFLMQHPKGPETDYSSLDLVLYGASPIPLDLLRAAVGRWGCQFIGLYGMTEAHGSVTALPPEEHDPDNPARMRSVGKPLGDFEIKVVGGDGNELPAMEVGEILIRGPKIMPGYWNLPEATASAIRDGWFHSGDAGYFDAEGYLYIHDRVKDMIVSGGENVYPAEVESALFSHDAVADVAVIGVPDPRWGEAVKAIVVTKDGAAVSADDLIGHARARIAGYKVPKSIDFADALPRNPSGKILKRELRKPFWEGREKQVN